LSKKIILIDGNSLVYRAFFALPVSLVTSYGQVTNAVYGFTSMLIKLMREFKPDAIVVAFDKAAPTFRHDRYAEYKAHREKAPAELPEQFPLVKEVLEALQIPIFEVEGYEADDILATLARKAKEKSNSVLIVTGDRDALQLIDENVKVVTTKKGLSDIVIYDRAKVVERWGVPPEKIPDFLALKGDPSDNIPGVPGIGEKIAARLVKEYGSLEKIVESLASIREKRWRRLIEEHLEEARLSKQLSILDTEVPVDIDFEQINLATWDEIKIRKVFSKLEFFTLLDRLFEGQSRQTVRQIEDKIGKVEIKRVVNPEVLSELKEALTACRELGLALAVSRQGKFREKIDWLALALSDHLVYLLQPNNRFWERLRIKQWLKEHLESPQFTIVAHDFKKIKRVLDKHFDIHFDTSFFDIMLAAYLLKPGLLSYPLNDLAVWYLDTVISEEPLELKVSQEAVLSLQLKEKLTELLQKENLLSVFEEIELPLVDVLYHMERTGIGIDKQSLAEMEKEVDLLLENTAKEIFYFAGEQFNINSPQQLRHILFEKLQLSPLRKTKTGYSTDISVLAKLVNDHPIIEKIITYRELSKLKSTYIEALPKLINPRTGKLHTTFNQAGTATGRLSSSNPNLQNIPIKGEWGQKIRRAFVPSRKADVFIAADYSQIELRLLAHFSGDEGLIAAFDQSVDIHKATACQLFNTKPTAVTPQMRRLAKAVNFGVIYGMSPYGLAERLSISTEEAKAYIDRYFEKYPAVANFISQTIKQAKKDGYVVTLLGRKRYIPELASSNQRVRNLGERLAINTPLQGSASDLIKLAMIRLHQYLRRNGLQSRMVLQVHDELIFEVPALEKVIVIDMIKSIMEGVYPLKVKLKVDINEGTNWCEVK
jgi:DNA polymerase-1